METLAWTILALLSLACGVYVMKDAWPVRRVGEGWVYAYFRVLWRPGAAVLISVYACSGVFDMRIFDLEEPSAEGFAACGAVLLFIMTVTWIDRRGHATSH